MNEPIHHNGETMQPKLFDVRANDVRPRVGDQGVPILQPWKRVTLDPDYAGAWIVAGDVDGDGQVEIVSAKNYNENDVHYTSSVVVHRLDGSVLWRWGDPAEGRNQLHHDVACQIYDWDGDGRAEVVLAAKGVLVELDGATGEEKRGFAIPENASDCVTFANLSGGPRASEVLVKTRYGQIWAYNDDGRLLWTVEEPAGFKTAHQARPIDVDGDGVDEIMAGFALLNPDGTVRWDLGASGPDRGHLDCVRVFERGHRPAETKLVLTCCGGNRLLMVDGNGDLIWSLSGHHFESINVGKVCPDVPGKQIVVDIDHRPRGESPLWVLDQEGDLFGQIITDGSRHHALVDWFGQGIESIVMGTAAALFDCAGNKVTRFDATKVGLVVKGDLTGNGVPDLMFSSNPASELTIFRNELGKPPEDGVPLGTGVNYTLY